MHVDPSAAGETSAHTADGGEAPAGATDAPEPKEEPGATQTSG
jgi:hypothetical protein